MQRRGFLKAIGAAFAASAIGIKVSAAAERVWPKAVDPLAAFTPEILPDGRKLYRFKIGSGPGMDFKTFQEFQAVLPKKISGDKTEFRAEVYNDITVDSAFEVPEGNTVKVHPAPGLALPVKFSENVYTSPELKPYVVPKPFQF